MSAPERPVAGPPPKLRVPKVAETTLPSGLRAYAIRHPSVPRVELRLRIPAGLARDTGNQVRARLVPETLLGGVPGMDSLELARELQRLGASLDAYVGADDLVLRGATLADRLGPFLDLVAEVVARPTFPTDDVAVARERVAQEIIIQNSQPGTIARQALNATLFGRHPYGRGLPAPGAVRRVTPAVLKAYHADRVLPRGSTLLLVGDLRQARALERASTAFARWRRRGTTQVVAEPEVAVGGPLRLVPRPGAVQTNVRVAARAVSRGHEDFAALALANAIFGGYSSSRIFENLRERRGYTYSPRSGVDHCRTVSTFALSADVGTEVTAPALVEIRYELARLAATAPEADELESARRYLAGSLAIAVQTQSGLADQVDALIASGVGAEWLRDYTLRLRDVTAERVREVAERYLSPRRVVTVLVGDPAVVPPIEALEPVEILTGGGGR